MDCRETRTLLTACHDGELPAADRGRVEEHLRGCPECAARLAGLARIDQAAGVPDPGPAYWDRFNARVMDRIAREADGPGVRAPRPKGGWMREQLRYLVPAAAAAALVLVIVHYGGMRPGAPTPTVPHAVGERAAPDPAGERRTKVEPAPRPTEKAESRADARPVPPPVPAGERRTAVTREERGRLADPSLPAGSAEAFRDRADAPAAAGAPAPAPVPAPDAPAGSPAVSAADGMRMSKEQAAEAPPAAPLGKTRQQAGPSSLAPAPADPPCDLARALAARERWRAAEDAQRACLARDRSARAQEKGLVFLAELLDRQARFADADAVIAEVDRRYPQSRPLDLYRRQRPMVQKQPAAVPVPR